MRDKPLCFPAKRGRTANNMSGLLALLDDVAAIAKVAATSVDDVVAQAAKAGTKAAGAVIDDAAVTPKYVSGFSAERELPIVWRIAKGSIFNKIVILLPIALALSQFAPWAIPPLLMLGGAYLCFEGAEKVAHWLNPHDHYDEELLEKKKADAHLEEQKVKGAIKTDFILSAEIMTIILSSLPAAGIAFTAGALAAAGLMITVAVYGAVALIVKMDDVGLHMASSGRLGATRALGQGIVHAMPKVLKLLTIVGTAAMLWVGGSIIVHGLKELGQPQIYDFIHHTAEAAVHGISGPAVGFLQWMIVAAFDGVFGLLLGLLLLPVVNRVITPVVRLFRRPA
jgi:predicted DNA repair protein MutK